MTGTETNLSVGPHLYSLSSASCDEIEPNRYISNLINKSSMSVNIAFESSMSVCIASVERSDQISVSTTDLDSHANMAVLGKNCLILNNTGLTANVRGFSPDCGVQSETPIVDAMLKWQ